VTLPLRSSTLADAAHLVTALSREEWEKKYALPAQASVKRNSLPSAVG
jgi:hypothetical protein